MPGSVFYPPAAVDSQVLHLELRPSPLVVDEERTFFEKVVRAAFAQKRKTIANSLASVFGPKPQVEDLLRRSGIEPRCRAESLGIDRFIELSRNMAAEYGPKTLSSAHLVGDVSP